MEFSSITTLDTKGYCIFCFRKADVDELVDENMLLSPLQALETRRQFCKMSSRHLGTKLKFMNPKKSMNLRQSKSSGDDIYMNTQCEKEPALDISHVCHDCSVLVDKFCRFYSEMKCLELKVDWQVRKLKTVMAFADRAPTRGKHFKTLFPIGKSKETENLARIESFRKELMVKYNQKFRNTYPRIIFKRKDTSTTATSVVTTASQSKSRPIRKKTRTTFVQTDPVSIEAGQSGNMTLHEVKLFARARHDDVTISPPEDNPSSTVQRTISSSESVTSHVEYNYMDVQKNEIDLGQFEVSSVSPPPSPAQSHVDSENFTIETQQERVDVDFPVDTNLQTEGADGQETTFQTPQDNNELPDVDEPYDDIDNIEVIDLDQGEDHDQIRGNSTTTRGDSSLQISSSRSLAAEPVAGCSTKGVSGNLQEYTIRIVPATPSTSHENEVATSEQRTNGQQREGNNVPSKGSVDDDIMIVGETVRDKSNVANSSKNPSNQPGSRSSDRNTILKSMLAAPIQESSSTSGSSQAAAPNPKTPTKPPKHASTKARRYRCRYCDVRFIRKCDLTRHKATQSHRVKRREVKRKAKLVGAASKDVKIVKIIYITKSGEEDNAVQPLET